MNIKKHAIFLRSSIADPLLLSLILYFALSPIEFIINTVIPGGSSVKYLGAIIIVIAFLRLIRFRKKIRIHKSTTSFYLWIFIMTISYYWAVSLSGWIFYYQMYLNMLVFYIVISFCEFNKNQIRLLVNAYLFGTIVLLFYFLTNLTLINDSGIRYSIFVEGILYDPNNLAVFFVYGLVLSFYRFYVEEYSRLKYFIFFIIYLLAIFLTGSRGAAISALACILVILMLKIKEVRILEIVKIGTIILISFFLLRKLIPSELYNRIIDINSYDSGSSRTYLWNASFSIIKQNLILGSGIGAISNYGITHNTYLTVLLETGLVGFILFTFSILSTLIEGFKGRRWLGVLIMISSLMPAFFLDSLVKRFFWNGLIIAMLVIRSKHSSNEAYKN